MTRRLKIRGLWLTSLACALSCLGGQVIAQEASRNRGVLDLPRKGYEPRRLHFGSTVISPELRLEGVYDSNIFALPDSAEDDLITVLKPRIDVENQTDKLYLGASIQAEARKYLDHPQEDAVDYGMSLESEYSVTRTDKIAGIFRYNRSVESRTDPESEQDVDEAPTSINAFVLDTNYAYRRNRIGLAVQAAVERLDYLSSDESDRDFVRYVTSYRGSFLLTPHFDAFVQPFLSRRDHDNALDRNGRDPDTTTYGFLAGTRVDITNKIVGQLGLGIFYADPDSAQSDSFFGLSARGQLSWFLDERTILTANVFRGDVATVRAGASGRIDTSIALGLQQEAFHNILLNAKIAFVDTKYIGTEQSQTTSTFAVEGEYLINRQLSAFLGFAYSDRSADLSEDEFDRSLITLGLRGRF
jgi:hypothetical protein